MSEATVLWVGPEGAEQHEVRDVKALLERDNGFVWVDLALCDPEAVGLLSDVFKFHPRAVSDCQTRAHLPKLFPYPDHLFAIVHGAEPGEPGHVHLLELKQFVGISFLVTVHGPLGEGVPLESALRETAAVRHRIESGRFIPASPAELAHAIVSGLCRHTETLVSALATRIAALERRIMKEEAGDPQRTLEEIFLHRHELLTMRTLAVQTHQVYVRMAGLSRVLPSDTQFFIDDIIDQYARLSSLCDGEKDFLQGVLDFHESRTATKMNIAMERLALLTAILLPITALSGIYGMNIIVNSETDFPLVMLVVASMVAVTVLMFRWARRQGWW